MLVEVLLPQWGMGMKGVIVNWFKGEGDTVEAGEPLAEVEAAKATSDVEAPASGVLHKILAEVDETVEVRSVIAVIDDGSPAAQ
ncbi:lipoyl domain-containing protein [Amycolatopsis sp.]|jgi:pyruvate/2-oxoglutarate dehydrogenase complex dihydrolipoamide acyltransferase (E2) component|uniref:lipoyl domain-containing protein n=1 Tax=Amycolatopsis sp. TaxID=37632 RepID=UPI002E09362A|nr:lipoyl domain-containing protein [Amycolatopsis sp.]